MAAVIGIDVEASATAGAVIVGGIEFDVRPSVVFVGGIEFDTVAAGDSDSLSAGGMGYVRASSTSANTSPSKTAKRYDDDSYRQEQARVAAELADEEIVLAFLMEYALHV